MKAVPILAAALTLGACASVATEPTAQDRAALAEALGGRVAVGQPVACIQQRDLGGNRSIGSNILVFDARVGDTLYVNRPPSGCPAIGPSRTLITRSSTAQLCRGDIVEVVDVTSNMSFGSCGLGDFTRYERP